VGEISFWYRPTRVVPDQRPLNGRCCCCFSIGNGQPSGPALCQLYRRTFVPYNSFSTCRILSTLLWLDVCTCVCVCVYPDGLAVDFQSSSCVLVLAGGLRLCCFNRNNLTAVPSRLEITNRHHDHGRIADEGRRVVAPRCPRSTARLQSSPVGRVESFRSWSSHVFRGRPGGRRHVRSGGRCSDTSMWS